MYEMNIILIGSGKWGKNYIKAFEQQKNKLIAANRENWKDLVKNCDGVIIATPPNSHIEIATHCLNEQKPVMIEKPLALSLNECFKLKQFNLPILVNHIHLFTAGYQNIKNIIDPSSIVEIQTIVNNNSELRDYSILWDYGPHDLSLIFDLLNKEPINYKIKNNSHSKIEFDLEFINCKSNTFINSKAQKKDRSIDIYTNNGNRYFYNDAYRPDWHPQPLNTAINVFLNAINGKQDSRLGLDLSFKIIKWLEILSKM